MGRQHSSDPTLLHSSIALLQERFRQLQRVKEMREERELMRMFAEADRSIPNPNPNPNSQHELQPQWLLHPELFHPSRPSCNPPSFQFQTRSECSQVPSCDSWLSIGLYPNRPNSCASNNVRESDVDTSLHL